MDTRVWRDAEIYSDHYLVMTKCKEQLDKKQIYNREGIIEYKSIRSYKLKSRDVSNRFI